MPDKGCVQRARALLGIPFRLHGRSLASGLDCVGLVALATGRLDDAPVGYSLRTTRPDRWFALLDTLGPQVDAAEPGAVLLFRPGPAQLHLGIGTGISLIHADAGLRRVVETPAPFAWPLLGAWRLRCDAPSTRID